MVAQSLVKPVSAADQCCFDSVVQARSPTRVFASRKVYREERAKTNIGLHNILSLVRWKV